MSTTSDQADTVIRRNTGRPVPIPQRPWASFQSWNNLLLCHWPIDPALIRPKVPAELELDLFDGQAWIGLIPMFMGEIRLRDLSIPTEPNFPELNFRTYVRYGGRTGVYFFAIYAQALFADFGARAFFHTPYMPALVEFEQSQDGFHLGVHRELTLPPHAKFDAVYKPKGAPFPCPPGSIEAFLSERYSAFAKTLTGKIVRGDLIHDPWQIQDVDAEVRENTILAREGFNLPVEPAQMHYAPGVQVVLWTFEDADQS
jgi:uncharacterized protein YqjF (DUF2071 family)